MYKNTFNWGFAELLDIPIRTTLCLNPHYMAFQISNSSIVISLYSNYLYIISNTILSLPFSLAWYNPKSENFIKSFSLLIFVWGYIVDNPMLTVTYFFIGEFLFGIFKDLIL